MGKVKLLDEQTINEIAAGEVIENPASVVKELVENSIDAGSTQIEVEIRGGGRQFIRISDDGCGMSPEDAIACLERHATSKLRSGAELFALQTLGFRGEAIPSIAAISKFTLHTAEHDEEGTLLIVEGGKLLSCGKAPRRGGTTIEVKQLFFNVPVRQQFQRSPAWDAQEVTKVCQLQALSHPLLRLRLTHHGEELYSAKATAKTGIDLLTLRLQELLGEESSRSFKEVKAEQGPYKLHGLIALPQLHRPNRNGQYLFVNGRCVFLPLLSNLIRQSYSTLLPERRHPLFLLYLEMPADALDVNVHPQKKEVRIRDEEQLRQLVEMATAPLLFGTAPIAASGYWQTTLQPSIEIEKALFVSSSPITPSPPSSLEKISPQPLFSASANPLSLPWEEDAETAQTELAPALPRQMANSAITAPLLFHSLQTKQWHTPKVLCLLPGWILLEPASLIGSPWDHEGSESQLLLIDQRRAHQRLLYEAIELRWEKDQPLERQKLLLPYPLALTAIEQKQLLEHKGFLEKIGFEFVETGPDQLAIESYPALLQEADLTAFIERLLTELSKGRMGEQLINSQRAERFSELAMQSGVQRTKQLKIEQAQLLINGLTKAQKPHFCPKGRPIALSLTASELTRLIGSKNL